MQSMSIMFIPIVNQLVEVEFTIEDTLNTKWFKGIVRHVDFHTKQAYIDFFDGYNNGWYPYEVEMQSCVTRTSSRKLKNTYYSTTTTTTATITTIIVASCVSVLLK